MWNHVEPVPVLPVAAVFSGKQDLIEQAARRVESVAGSILARSETVDFSITNYYETQMGPELRKQLVAFSTLSDPGLLADWKHQTNRIEQEMAAETPSDVQRPVNIDIGYLSKDKFVLATTKDASHRIYLSRYMYAEVTLCYKKKSYRELPWTYPDFRREDYIQFLNHIRSIYLEKLKSQTDF